MTRWIGGLDAAPDDQLADEHVLGQCSGRRTLDLGCGPGRFTAALRARGSAALGVDNSAVAVELTRRRGGAAVRRDLFAPLPAEGAGIGSCSPTAISASAETPSGRCGGSPAFSPQAASLSSRSAAEHNGGPGNVALGNAQSHRALVPVGAR